MSKELTTVYEATTENIPHRGLNFPLATFKNFIS